MAPEVIFLVSTGMGFHSPRIIHHFYLTHGTLEQQFGVLAHLVGFQTFGCSMREDNVFQKGPSFVNDFLAGETVWYGPCLMVIVNVDIQEVKVVKLNLAGLALHRFLALVMFNMCLQILDISKWVLTEFTYKP